MRAFATDMHVHTVLSPCAAREMTPPNIVKTAIREGLSMIAICDHNSAGNVAAVQEAAGQGLAVIAGIEVTTVEDVHVLGLFPESADASAVGSEVLRTLPELDEDNSDLSRQALTNARGDSVGRETRMLSASSPFSLRQTARLIRDHGGIVVPAHVDRPSFGLLGQLGLFPEDVEFDAVEVSAWGHKSGRAKAVPGLRMPVIVASDSHSLSEIGSGRTVFEMLAPTFAEFARAIRRAGTGGTFRA